MGGRKEERVKVNASEKKTKLGGEMRDEMMEERISGERGGQDSRDLAAAGLSEALPCLWLVVCRTMRPSLMVLTASEESQQCRGRRGGGRERGEGRGPCGLRCREPCLACTGTGTGTGTGVVSGHLAWSQVLFLAVGRSLRRAMGCPGLRLL
ncbi:hypothetical protein M441DRAFT_337824 [Trichoderma asperellum CBS 433.97]|uniref:Uncharacterized protein n=1 Tax=Trichoderma asperellum (strain ATCC 204424 / CBS 433.97 / NBRC 101777) TaxID=1042311 RepID=A0A2T3ZGL8_TRIA4|nr:hypothetical protein M441DRAFT_337824 [Trichoderma asperellum CBS 433.97]PTB43946.1 hypothetical protein M441DRAFT_337824 [Trichoderma asperellum CBS 433.97]